MLAFLLSHPLATEIFQKGEGQMTNATQSLQSFSALSQESPGMLWTPLLVVYFTSMQCCTVPGHDYGLYAEAVTYSPPPMSLAVNHIVPLVFILK